MDETDNYWKETAAQFARNADYYRGLVQKIGLMFGDKAFISDDGSKQQDVLCAKVPELVEDALNPPRATEDRSVQDKKWCVEKAAQVWCKPSCAKKTMDPELAYAFADTLYDAIHQPIPVKEAQLDKTEVSG